MSERPKVIHDRESVNRIWCPDPHSASLIKYELETRGICTHQTEIPGYVILTFFISEESLSTDDMDNDVRSALREVGCSITKREAK